MRGPRICPLPRAMQASIASTWDDLSPDFPPGMGRVLGLIALRPNFGPPDAGVFRPCDLLPDVGPPGQSFPAVLRSARAICRQPFHELFRGYIADRTVWANFVVVSTPSLAFSGHVVEAHEPVRVQAFHAELPVQALDEGPRHFPRTNGGNWLDRWACPAARRRA